LRCGGFQLTATADAERPGSLLPLRRHQTKADNILEHVDVLLQPPGQATSLMRPDLPKRDALDLADD
jgi:hypothetical protein